MSVCAAYNWSTFIKSLVAMVTTYSPTFKSFCFSSVSYCLTSYDMCIAYPGLSEYQETHTHTCFVTQIKSTTGGGMDPVCVCGCGGGGWTLGKFMDLHVFLVTRGCQHLSLVITGLIHQGPMFVSLLVFLDLFTFPRIIKIYFQTVFR